MVRSKKERIKRVLEELEKLRLTRAAFNKSVNERELQLTRALCQLNGTDLFDVGAFDPVNDELSEVSSDIPAGTTDHLQGFLRTVTRGDFSDREDINTSPTISPNNSSRPIRVNDKVWIKNRVNRSGEDSESDRKAVVTKIGRVRLSLRTESGIETTRIRSNLLLL